MKWHIRYKVEDDIHVDHHHYEITYSLFSRGGNISSSTNAEAYV